MSRRYKHASSCERSGWLDDPPPLPITDSKLIRRVGRSVQSSRRELTFYDTDFNFAPPFCCSGPLAVPRSMCLQAGCQWRLMWSSSFCPCVLGTSCMSAERGAWAAWGVMSQSIHPRPPARPPDSICAARPPLLFKARRNSTFEQAVPGRPFCQAWLGSLVSRDPCRGATGSS